MPADAASLHRYQGARPIASLTLNGVGCISTITIRRRISKCACMRVTRTTALTSSSARYSRGAINCLCRVCKVLTTRLHKTSAMPRHQRQARGRIRVREEGRRHQRPRRHLLLQRRLRLQVLQRRDRRSRQELRQRQGLAQHLRQDRKVIVHAKASSQSATH